MVLCEKPQCNKKCALVLFSLFQRLDIPECFPQKSSGKLLHADLDIKGGKVGCLEFGDKKVSDNFYSWCWFIFTLFWRDIWNITYSVGIFQCWKILKHASTWSDDQHRFYCTDTSLQKQKSIIYLERFKIEWLYTTTQLVEVHFHTVHTYDQKQYNWGFLEMALFQTSKLTAVIMTNSITKMTNICP